MRLNLLKIKLLITILNNFTLFTKLKKKKYNEISLYVINRMFLNLITTLKKSTFFQYKTLTLISVIDYPSNLKRFKIIYNLLSTKNSNRIFISLFLKENKSLNSLNKIFPATNWLEREIFDMFGIFFTNHPDLRRILTDYGFKGYPLKKDFPLSGYIELHYNDELFNISYNPIELSQEFRTFNFNNPWEKLYE